MTEWSAEEDKTLADAVRTEGDGNWMCVATWLLARTAQDCLVRWRYSIDPAIRRGKWTAEEDERLRQGVARHGAKLGWAKWVPGHMNGRTAPQCRERWVNSLDPTQPCFANTKAYVGLYSMLRATLVLTHCIRNRNVVSRHGPTDSRAARRRAPCPWLSLP